MMGIWEKVISSRLHLPFKPALSLPPHTSLRTKNIQLIYATSFSGHRFPANQFSANLTSQGGHLSSDNGNLFINIKALYSSG